MGDAPAPEGAPAPPPEGAPPAEGVVAPPPEVDGTPPEGEAPPPAPTGLNINPPATQVPAAGGQSVHQLANPGGVLLAFKVLFFLISVK